MSSVIQHCVLITFVPEATDEQQQAVVEGLRALPSTIETIVSYHVGLDLGFADGNASVGIVAQFADEAGWRTYQDHPDHQAVIADLIAPIRQSRVATQFPL
ncbi:hypothetical protein B7486_63980 [cyanobacterium TDX16]|nr:hypothetical protein B7486_63980 [cyanobacterium TDX16]